jgi:uncharacterized protein
MTLPITIPNQSLKTLCEQYHIRRVLLFGSVLREDFTSESDIDVLVEFDSDARIGLFEMVDIRDELEALFHRRVDLGTPAGLSKYVRNKVLASAQVIYEDKRS